MGNGCNRTARLVCSYFFLLVIGGRIADTVEAQSTRPGWGATLYHVGTVTGATFRVWAPHATSANVRGTFNGWSATANPLTQEKTNGVLDGVWSADVNGVTNLAQYKFYFNGNLWKNDPRARMVTVAGSGGNSIVYDPTAFNWKGDNFTNPPQNNLFIYEMHVGTFYTNGSPVKFIAATNRLDYLKSLGINVVELMPVAEFGNSGSSWGYDAAQPFAVDYGQYGGADGLKTFVQECHARGVAVFLDIVHNHYGPSLLDMWNFDGWSGSNSVGGGGIYFFQTDTALQITSYGNTRPNVSSNEVFNFIQDNITEWLNEYHLDGFRWDTPNLLMHDNNNNYIPAAGNLLTTINAGIHTNYTGKISIAEDTYNSKGFDSAWDTSLPGSVTPVLAQSSDANRDMTVISNAIQHNVRYGGTATSNRVAFLESHDVVGDLNSGTRLVTAIDSSTPDSYRARKLSTLGSLVTLTAPGIPMVFQEQEMLESNSFDSARIVDWTKTNTYSRIVQFYRDLIGNRLDLKGYTPGLRGDQCSVSQMDNVNKFIAFRRWNSAVTNQTVVVAANFTGAALNNYIVNFPFAGNWYVHLNSDSTNYSSDYGNIGSAVVTATGNPPTAAVTLGPYSGLILSPTPDAPPQLTSVFTNGGVQLSWPAVYSEWTLVTKAALDNTNWVMVPNTTFQTNAAAISVSFPASGMKNFYRLQK